MGKGTGGHKLDRFGNPNLGTVLMPDSRMVAIDLPQKMLVWEDEAGAVHDPKYLAERHRITDNDEIINKIFNALAGLIEAAAN